MSDYSKDFAPFEGKVWLNCASEGPIPLVSAQEAKEAVEWKLKPFNLTNERFQTVPLELKKTIGRLMNVSHHDVILGNSATYGIHLLANGIPLEKGDEILLMQNDFPTDILPFLGLEEKGVVVRQIKTKGPVLEPDELTANMTKKTRVLCLSYVHTFSGYKIDVRKLSEICRRKKIIFILNCSQALGSFPVDIKALGVDAMTTAGFKWLLGPYATGFCWMKKELRETLKYNQAYWISMMTAEDLKNENELVLRPGRGARQYDVFGTANFFNFKPFRASIEYLLKIGLDKVQAHNDQMQEKILKGLDRKKFVLVSPEKGARRSGLCVFSHKDKNKNESIFQALIKENIYLALWKNNLRASPHIFNTDRDIDRLLSVLNALQ